MRLWSWGRKPVEAEPTLDISPLKKIVAVSDEYWAALYSPIIDPVARSLSVYKKQKRQLYCDYVDQFVGLIRDSKGMVQDDPLSVHLYTYSLSITFSALYVARLCHGVEFIAISKAHKTKGERLSFYPWIEMPSECDIKLAKVDRLYPAYVHAISIFHTMMNEISWKWLHSRPAVLKGLLDSIHSNGEKGLFSGILDNMRAAPISHSVDSVVQSEHSGSRPVEDQSPEESTKESGSLDDLISQLSDGVDDIKQISLDDLLDNSNTEKSSVSTSSDALNEFTALLESSTLASKNDKNPIKNKEDVYGNKLENNI